MGGPLCGQQGLPVGKASACEPVDVKRVFSHYVLFSLHPRHQWLCVLACVGFQTEFRCVQDKQAGNLHHRQKSGI